ncbi:hypothetical protein A6P54_16680 [Bacillus sp. MKU004]|nr:hypothetical protein A6P54_16680 [Bacillus sp. MKU004]
MKKAGITFLFILICAGASLVLMNVFNEAAGKVKDFYHVEDPGGEGGGGLPPGKEGRTISEKRLKKPIVVEEYLRSFSEPFSGGFGRGSGFVNTAKKYGVFVILGVVFLFWYLRRKKKKRKGIEVVARASEHARNSDKSVDFRNPEDRTFPLTEEKLNEIRKMMMDWEKQLNTSNRKRSNETLHEWFRRINGPIEIIPIYEKVRYGGKPFTYEEVQLLKRFLK